MRNVAAIAVCLMVSCATAGFAAEPDPAGRADYVRFCAACHGPQGKGDGVVGGFMRPAPSDLTQLAARHGGEFPTALVVRAIDGREMHRAHGEPAMPVWGLILGNGDRTGDRPLAVERRVHARIYGIAEYLRSLQAK